MNFYTRNFLTDSLPSKIAWIGSLQWTTPFVLGVVSGKLFDKGHFRILVIIGSIIFSASRFLLELGFAQAVRGTAYVVTGCLIASIALMRNNPAVYDLHTPAPPPDIRSLLTDVPYMVGVLGMGLGRLSPSTL
ncbi:hypothetical protein DXG01_000965 [Tephrocybe rancida]|nr:hypothetical protein DXG01_000965 [Tephrocybe rancida]